jgi:cobaltochelatase CobN
MLKVDLFSTQELDSAQEIYASCAEASEQADFILINIFGSLAFFKSFHKYFEAFKGKKRFYINTTIEEEVSELFPQCGIMTDDFSTIFKYYKADGTEKLRKPPQMARQSIRRDTLTCKNPFCRFGVACTILTAIQQTKRSTFRLSE